MVRRTADAAAADFDPRADVVHRLPEDLEGLLAAALLDEPARTVEDTATEVLLAVAHQLVDEGRDRRIAVHQVGLELADFCSSTTSHA